MKTRLQNGLKLALVAVFMLSIGAVSAQTTSGSIGKATAAALGSNGGSVKVIDNKGTIKYLQSNNGITMFTDTAPDGGVITTWQLGGSLTENTNINTGDKDFEITVDGAAGGTFKIQGIDYIAATDVPAADETATTGYTLLVRDEATGVTKKMLASDLVSGIRLESPQTANVTSGTTDIAVVGLPTLTATSTAAKLFVYRNGAKLRFGTDFSIAAAGTVTFDNAEVPFYVGDIIEIQYIK
ncbi:hypothetical protein [Lutibacter citreus]|uniref:hypothetical protein n=1 Tax=Lutibacter citreus TaxID=2138210 RepID=UPI000DBE1606|nr:hypothetical protein [Lutibacter citreus]